MKLFDYDPVFIHEDVNDLPSNDNPMLIDANMNDPDSSTSSPNNDTSTNPKIEGDSNLRRGTRVKKRNQFIWDRKHNVSDSSIDTGAFLMQKTRLGTINNAFLNSLDWNVVADGSINSHWDRFNASISRNMDHIHRTLENPHPMMLAAKANSEDNPNWHTAMNGPYSDQFFDAMVEEINTLEQIGAWTKVLKDKSMNILKSTWAFKVKRHPSGLIRKFKARFSVRGDMQIEGVDFDETFAPVVNWITVRTLLILSQQLNLATGQAEYTAAFPQAELNDEVYVDMPRGFKEDEYVYKLNKSLYGLRQSPRNFHAHLSKQLQAVRLKPSPADQCLFIGQDCICLTYVDDCLFFAKSADVINNLIEDLRKQGATLNLEDDVAGFLGVDIARKDDGTIEMTQTGLT